MQLHKDKLYSMKEVDSEAVISSQRENKNMDAAIWSEKLIKWSQSAISLHLMWRPPKGESCSCKKTLLQNSSYTLQ